MVGRKFKVSITTLGAALVALSGGAESHAQLCNLFHRPAPQVAVTTYRPLYAPAPVVAQTVNYVPYTGYRTVYMPTAVTTMQPAPACNACGGATTVMRPVVTYAMRPQLIPYAAYQPVVAAPALVAAPACSTCSAGYAPPVAMQYAPVAPTSYAAPMNAPSVAPAYSAPPAAPGCGCNAGAPALGANFNGAPGYAPGPGQIGSSVSSLAGAANIAPSLPMNQPIPSAPSPSYPQSSYPQSSYPQAPPAGAGTTFAPGSAMYGGTALPSTAGAGYPSATPFPSTTIIGPPQPITKPASPADSASGAASRLISPGTNSGASPKTTFKDPALTQPDARPIPDPRWTDRFQNPSDAAPSGAPAGKAGSGSGGSGTDSPSTGAGVVNPQETNFQQPRAADPEDRMASRVIRQTTIYRSVSSSPAPVVALDDNAWHAVSPRP